MKVIQQCFDHVDNLKTVQIWYSRVKPAFQTDMQRQMAVYNPTLVK